MDSFKKAVEPTEEQKRQQYDQLPESEKKKQTYYEWAASVYANQYERWMPWIEDQYLRWFGKGDNKASYATKDALSKTKVTGIKQVDQIQDDINNLIGNQVGENGLFAPIGNMVSKEGINRAERGGKEEDGTYGVAGQFGQGAKDAGGAVANGAQTVGGSVLSGAQTVGGGVAGGVKDGAGLVGGLFGEQK